MAANQVSGDLSEFATAIGSFKTVSTKISDAVAKPPELPDVGGNGGSAGSPAHSLTGQSVEFPAATAFVTAFTQLHNAVITDVGNFSDSVASIGTVTSAIRDTYANTLDRTKVGADQVKQAFTDLGMQP